MRNKKWLWGALLALPLAAAGIALAGATSRADAAPEGAGIVCPLTGVDTGATATHPLTGEELPGPNCCPLNGQ